MKSSREYTLAGITFRPLTGGSVLLCRRLGLTFLDSFESLRGLLESEVQRQVFTFLYIHGCPSPEEMLRAVYLPPEQFEREHLIPFAIPFPLPAVLPFILGWLSGEREATAEQMAEVIASIAKLEEAAPEA